MLVQMLSFRGSKCTYSLADLAQFFGTGVSSTLAKFLLPVIFSEANLHFSSSVKKMLFYEFISEIE